MKKKSIKIDINNTSDHWFKPEIDRRVLKELLVRSDYEGWRHIIIYFISITFLGLLSVYFWGSLWFIILYLSYT